jgi:cell division protein FtsL
MPWKSHLLNGVLLVMVVASAFAVISTTHSCRQLYAQLQGIEARQWYLQEDYGRLLLELSVWASHHRVEGEAVEQLGMTTPALDQVRLVSQ